MSFPEKGKVLPKKGNVLPNEEYAIAIASALRQDLGNTRRAIKTVGFWTGASERTVKYWFAGSSGPSGEHLVALIRHSDSVLGAVLVLAGKEKIALGQKLAQTRDELIKILDALQAAME